MVVRNKANTLLENYFWIFFISQIGWFVTGKQYIISLFFPVLLYYLAFGSKKSFSGIFDIIVYSILSCMLFTWLCNDYPNKLSLIFRCVIGEISYILAYFIGKRCEILSIIVDKAKVPLLICSIIGIIWFFRPPGAWYTATYDDYSAAGLVSGFSDLLRLKSIFSSPYVMSYLCALSFITIIFKKKLLNSDYAILVIYALVMVLCMMRAPIFGVIIAIIIILVEKVRCGLINITKLVLFMIPISLSIIVVSSVIQQNIDLDTLNFLNEKFLSVTDGGSDFIKQRIDHQGGFERNYNFIGDGAGRHAIYSDDYNPQTSIRDSEYIRIIVELGYFGLILYILLLLFAVLKCIRYYKYLKMDMCVISFYIITMIGANSLTTQDKHGFIFWLIMGHIASFNLKKRNNLKKSLLPGNNHSL